jgi:hypothetical protein
MVLQRRLVDLRGEGDFVLGIGLHRVEMLGTLGKCRVEDVPAALGARIGVVLLAPAGREQEQQRQKDEAKNEAWAEV